MSFQQTNRTSATACFQDGPLRADELHSYVRQANAFTDNAAGALGL